MRSGYLIAILNYISLNNIEDVYFKMFWHLYFFCELSVHILLHFSIKVLFSYLFNGAILIVRILTACLPCIFQIFSLISCSSCLLTCVLLLESFHFIFFLQFIFVDSKFCVEKQELSFCVFHHTLCCTYLTFTKCKNA